MKKLLFIVILAFISCTNKGTDNTADQNAKQNKVQVLLVGTSHWNNYQSKGLDVAQTNEVDILSSHYQKDLDEIVSKIKSFNPSKIFVERTIRYQPNLDSLYQLYCTSDWGENRRNEIYQLGFKVAKSLNHKRVYGIDFRNTRFPYDSLIKAMHTAKQTELIASFDDELKQYEQDYNKLIAEKKPLKEILYFLNDETQRKIDLSWYLNGANKGGDLNTSVGSFLASEWIKRNIYSYGLILKYTEPTDERIMILMGASHIAVLENLIAYHPEWEKIELKTLME